MAGSSSRLQLRGDSQFPYVGRIVRSHGAVMLELINEMGAL
jgi:hypothetical protein